MLKKLFFIAFILISVSIFAQTPILKNFRIFDNEPSKVYFDADKDITSLTQQGFIISGKTISSINKSEKSFTVSTPFTFWDNNTIRLENGNGTIRDFTLQYIENNISEPKAVGKVYYVSLNGDDKNDGLSEGKAFRTISKAAKEVKPGSTIMIKAGNYGNDKVSFKKSGALNNPIKIIGYKNTIGDLDGEMYFKYTKGKPLDPSEMPLLNGKGGNGINISSNYIIIKNIQVQNFEYNFRVTKSIGVIIDNCITHVSGRSSYKIESASDCRITNSISVNADTESIKLVANNSLIDNCKVYADTNDGRKRTDYYFTVRGLNNVLRNSMANNVEDGTHSGHGISVKSVGIPTEYNLIENCDVYDVNFPIESRHDEVKFNIFRDIRTHSTYTSRSSGGSILCSNGSSFNTFENITIKNGLAGIRFSVSNEDPSAKTMSHDNTFINCIFNGNVYGIYATEDSGSKNRRTYNNKVINCTFYNNDYMFGIETNDIGNNEIINSNIVKTKTGEKKGSITGFTYSHSNFFDNAKYNTPSGNNNISVDPKFENAPQDNFRLKANSQLIDKGKKIEKINVDFDGIARPQGDGIDIGAFEYEETSTSSIDANAGQDILICKGESNTLTASGGLSYVWSTGETTSSINVSPLETTTYTVTVSDGSDSDSDEVTVTVDDLPSVILEADTTICYGETVTLIATGEGNFLWNTGETTSSITVSPLVTTTYTVVSSNSCSTTATDDIIVNVESEIILDAGANATICSGESTTLTATGNSNFLWSTGETTASITVNPTITTIYTVESSSGSCSLSDEVTVTVDDLPSVSLEADTTICYGETVTLTATGEGNFLWSTGETTSSITVSPIATTTYTVVSSNSCSTTATDEIIVNVEPEIILDAGADTSICSGESVTLTAIGNGNFLWSTGETTASITVNPSATTVYFVSSTEGNCKITDDVIVRVESSPSVSLGEDVSLCSGGSITLSAVGTGNFLWSTGETTSSITVNPLITTSYNVIASTPCGGQVSDEIIVNVIELPLIDAGSDITIANGSSTVLSVSGDGNFLWNTGETTSSITVNPSTTTIYTATITTKSGCSSQDSVIVTISNTPETAVFIEANPDQTICLNENVTLTATGGTNYLWNTGETTSSVMVSPTETTIFAVTISTGDSVDVYEITIFVDETCSGISNRLIEKKSKFYPNPTHGELHIELTGFSSESNISVYDLNGRLVYSENIDNYSPIKILNRQIDLSRFGKGIYFVRLLNNNISETKKILVI